MLRKLYMVDVLVLVPEYLEPSAMITSAFELVQELAKAGPFRYTISPYAEEDPRFDIDYERAFGGRKTIHLQQYVNGSRDSEDVEFMNYEGRENTNPYEYMDSKQSFEARVRIAQKFLMEEAQEEWYEMNRPDFSFEPNRTLGLLVNPYGHERGTHSGPVQEAQNIAVVPAVWKEEHEIFGHIYMAQEFLAAPLRFALKSHDADGVMHSIGRGCINDRVRSEEDLARRFEYGQLCASCQEKLREELPNFDAVRYLDRVFGALREKQESIASARNKHARLEMELQSRTLCLRFSDIGISIPLTAKEYALYHFLLDHSKGLSRESVGKERKVLFQYYANVRQAITKQIQVRINTLIDGWQYTNDLRVTVGKINAKFRKVEHLPGMKDWMITRVGDRFRIQAKA